MWRWKNGLNNAVSGEKRGKEWNSVSDPWMGPICII